MEEKLRTNLCCKNNKPRRKFECDKDSIYRGAKVRMSDGGKWWRVKNMKVFESSLDNPTNTAREMAGIYRFLCPSASIHIRRGHRVAVHPYNELDCLRLLKYYILAQRNQGKEVNIDVLLSDGQIISIDEIEIF